MRGEEEPKRVVFELDLDVQLDFTAENGVVFSVLFEKQDGSEVERAEASLKELVEEYIEFGEFLQDYRQLYCVAHDLFHYAERLRAVAQRLEDQYDLFDSTEIDWSKQDQYLPESRETRSEMIYGPDDLFAHGVRKDLDEDE